MNTTQRGADGEGLIERVNGIHRLARACQHGNEPRSSWPVAFELIGDHAVVVAAEVERLTARLEALRHAADRFLSCLGEFDGDCSFCNEYADALEALLVADATRTQDGAS